MLSTIGSTTDAGGEESFLEVLTSVLGIEGKGRKESLFQTEECKHAEERETMTAEKVQRFV